MRKTLASRWLLPLTAMGLGAQTPGTLADNVKIDSPQARVLVVTEEPHHPSALHEHKMNRVMIYLGNGQFVRTLASGAVQKIDFKFGDVFWSPAEGPHTSEYIADKPFKLVEIELKTTPQSPPAMPVNDLLKVDPKHYHLEFENDQVRVVRVKFDAHEKGVFHAHGLNHIVVYLNDQGRGKTGEVRLDGPMAHNEENTVDHAVERLAIDLK